MDITIKMVLVYAMPWEAKQQAMKDITTILTNEKFDHRVAATFPLEQSAKAHEEIEKSNNYGSVIITVN
jgi:NADPH:quinone reductase-like Zn-dependent oxidoreductase